MRAELKEELEDAINKKEEERVLELMEQVLQHNESVLHAAVRCRSLPLLQLFCGKVDVNCENSEGQTPLFLCCACAYPDDANDAIFHFLSSFSGVHFNTQDKQGHTPLMAAASRSNARFAQVLKEKGAVLEIFSDSKQNAFHCACESKSSEVVLQLSKEVPRESLRKLFDAEDSKGHTCVTIAAREGDSETLEILLSLGGTASLRATAGLARHLASTLEAKQVLEKYELAEEKWKSSSENRPFFSFKHSKPSKEAKKVFTSENKPLDLDYVSPPVLQGAALGMCMCPGRTKEKAKWFWKRDLDKDISAIKESGADVVVTLVREQELSSMGIACLFDKISGQGVVSEWFPIKDKWVPKDMEAYMDFISKLLIYVLDKKKVVVHCNGGKGRTVCTLNLFSFDLLIFGKGLIVTSILVTLGYDVDKAIKYIRSNRKGMIKNPAQITYLRVFKMKWSDYAKKKAINLTSFVEQDPSPEKDKMRSSKKDLETSASLKDSGSMKLNNSGSVKLNNSESVKLNNSGSVKLNNSGNAKLSDSGSVKLNNSGSVKMKESGNIENEKEKSVDKESDDRKFLKSSRKGEESPESADESNKQEK